MRRQLGYLVVLLVLCAGAACSSSAAAEDTSDMGDMSDDMGTMGSNEMDMDEMNMGDASATPAFDVAGGVVVTGSFELLDTRPPGSDSVAGAAWLARHDGGTTVTVELTGLQPQTEYIAHVHAEPCAPNNGGPHYQFEEGGEVTPPNEIHLRFAADGSGRGFMTAENGQTVDDRAQSVVVHPLELLDNKLVCAEF